MTLLISPYTHMHPPPRPGADDRTSGGHVLDAVLLDGTARILPLHHTQSDLPHSLAFLKADFSRDAAADVEAAEK